MVIFICVYSEALSFLRAGRYMVQIIGFIEDVNLSYASCALLLAWSFIAYSLNYTLLFLHLSMQFLYFYSCMVLSNHSLLLGNPNLPSLRLLFFLQH